MRKHSGGFDNLTIPSCSKSLKFLKWLKKSHENASPRTLANPASRLKLRMISVIVNLEKTPSA
jgi:hypothetical protein